MSFGKFKLVHPLMTTLRDFLLLLPPLTSSRGGTPAFRLCKINFDGVIINSSAARCCILCDWIGKLIKAGASHYGEAFILVAEARVRKDGVSATVEARFNKIVINHIFREANMVAG